MSGPKMTDTTGQPKHRRIWDPSHHLGAKAAPCPVCESEPILKDLRSAAYCVECPEEHGSHWTGPLAQTKKEAVRLWNQVMKVYWKASPRSQ